MWQKIEALLDSIVPAVETEAELECTLPQGGFSHLMGTLATEHGFAVRSAQPGDHVLEIPGKSFGDLEQLKNVFGKAEAWRYYNIKSRLRCCQTGKGTIKVVSYEHFVGLKKERNAFREVLDRRLNTAVDDLARICQDNERQMASPA